MKWPFKRKKDAAIVPQEIQEYYNTEKRERTSVAWLLALGTLLVTIALAIILFFAGRWLYRTVADRNNKSGNVSEQAVQDEPKQTPATDNKATSPSNNGGDSTATAPSPTTPQPTTSATAPLPDTGAGDVIAIFSITTLAGAIAHQAIYSRRRFVS